MLRFYDVPLTPRIQFVLPGIRIEDLIKADRDARDEDRNQ